MDMKNTLRWLVKRRVFCVMTTDDGEMLYPVKAGLSTEDLMAEKPSPGERSAKVIVLSRIWKNWERNGRTIRSNRGTYDRPSIQIERRGNPGRRRKPIRCNGSRTPHSNSRRPKNKGKKPQNTGREPGTSGRTPHSNSRRPKNKGNNRQNTGREPGTSGKKPQNTGWEPVSGLIRSRSINKPSPAKPDYEIRKRPDGFFTITDNKEPLPTFIVGDSVQLAKFIPVTIPVKTVEEATKWLVDRRIYCIIITSDGEFLWPAGKAPTEKDLTPMKPQRGERKVEVILLNVLSKYSPTGHDAPKAPRVTTAKPVPDKPMVLPSCFRIMLDRNREPIINYQGRPLPTVTIQWDVTKSQIAFARIPVETMDAAIEYVLYYRIPFFIRAGPKHFYCPIDTTTTEGDLTPMSPGSKAVQARVFNVKPLVEHAERWTITYSNVYPKIMFVNKAGRTVPMETYFIKGDQPTRATWREVTPTAATGRPDLSCIDLCTKLAYSWTAFRLKPRPVCWCGNNVDVTGLSSSVPSEPDYIQIISTGQLMEPLIVQILTNNKLTAQFEVVQEPNKYVQPFFKQPVSAPKKKLPRAFVREQPSGIEWYKVLGQDYIGCGPFCYAASHEYSSQQMTSGGGFDCRCGKTPAKNQPPQLPLTENAPEEAGLIEVIVLPSQPARTYKPSEIVIQTTLFTPRHMSVVINGKPLTPRFLKPADLKSVPGAYSPPNDPKKRGDCVTSCQSMGYNVMAVSKDYCICMPDSKLPLSDDKDAGISVYDLTPFLPKPAPGKGVTYQLYNMPKKYLRVLVKNVPVKIGFSKSKPDAVWKDQGQKDSKKCFEICHSMMMPFMMIKTSGSSTHCWCGATVDMKALEDTFPGREGYYEVIDISAIYIGSEFTFTQSTGLQVTSKRITNGYYSFVVILPGETQSSPLVVYYAQAQPTSLRLYTTTEKEPAPCVATCMEVGYDYAVLPYNGKPCQCGILVTGQQLRLPDKAPDTMGFIEVIQLRSLPAPAPSKSGGHSYKYIELSLGYCLFIINNVRAQFGFSSSKPDTVWKDQGQKDYQTCFDTCFSNMMPFMMVKTEGGSTHCWCGATVDMKSLEETFPEKEGYYEVIDISAMYIGSEFTVTLASGLKVTSKRARHGYFAFQVAVPGETKNTALVTYYTQSKPTSLRLYTTNEEGAAQCVATCTEIRCNYAILPSNGKPCQCGILVTGQQLRLPDQAPDARGFIEVVQLLSPPPPAPSKSGAHNFRYIEMYLGYCIFLIDGVRANLGFSMTKPDAVWKDQGLKSPEMCFDTCFSKMMSFMMFKKEGNSIHCWCGATVDMQPLEDTFPERGGYYEVIDISAMYIGTTFTVTHSSGLEVTSKRMVNGYYSLVYKVNAGASASPLTTYFTRSKPDGILWYPCSKKNAADCTLSCLKMKFQLAMMSTEGSSMSCQCGTLDPGQQLQLSDTSVPKTSGFIEVVQLPSIPETKRHPSGQTYIKCYWSTDVCYIAFINGEKIVTEFAPKESVMSVKGLTLDLVGTGKSCLSECVRLSFPKMACSKSYCRCMNNLQGLQTRGQYVPDANLLSVIDLTKAMPKPDDSRSMAIEKIPGTNYGRFMYSNKLMKTYFTQNKVDFSTGPPGAWSFAGDSMDFSGAVLACAGKNKNFVALMPNGQQFMCWCAKSVDLGALTTTIPTDTGYVQILDATKIISDMTSESRSFVHEEGRR